MSKLKKKIDNDVFSENDANCFSLSEALDGAARHYNSVFGIILGSGCGGGLVINKKIVSGANGLGGEWSLNQMPLKEIKSNIDNNEKFEIFTDNEKQQVVESIPGWAHDITNVGENEMIVLLWANEIFDEERPDTFSHEV